MFSVKVVKIIKVRLKKFDRPSYVEIDRTILNMIRAVFDSGIVGPASTARISPSVSDRESYGNKVSDETL